MKIKLKILLLFIFSLINHSCENNPSLCGVVDNCGVCDNNPTNDCTQDCYGTWGGSATNDCAGICEGLSKYDCDNNCISPTEDGVYDYDDVLNPGGGNFPAEGQCGCDEGSLPDECGVCGGLGAVYSCECSGLPQLGSGGDAGTNNFTILGHTNHIRGISFNEGDIENGFTPDTYGIIPAGTGVLTNLQLNGRIEYLENIIITRPSLSSNTVLFNYHEIEYCSADNNQEPTYEELDPNTMYVTSNDQVLYNSDVAIRSFEFTIVGGGQVPRACSCNGGALDCHYIPNECLNGHGSNQEECESEHCVNAFGFTASCNETTCGTQETCVDNAGYQWYIAGTWIINDNCSALHLDNKESCDTDNHCSWNPVDEEEPEIGECVLSGQEVCIERIDDIDNDGLCDDIDQCTTTSDIEFSCGDTEDEHGREYCGCLGEFGVGEFRCPVYDCSGICGGSHRQDTYDSNNDLEIVKDSIQADSLRLQECLALHAEEDCCEGSIAEAPNFCNDSQFLNDNNFNELAIDERCDCNQEAQDKPDADPYGGYGCCCEQTRDCAGDCDGTASRDDCGTCNGDNYFTEGLLPNGDCDCNGNIVDCDGTCGSGLVIDVCGVCGGTNSELAGQYVGPNVDCVGICFGTAQYDACGICGGESVDAGNCVECTDLDEDDLCDNVDNCIGTLDECGICNGNGIPNGECDCNGNVIDACGVCNGDGIPDGIDVCLRLEEDSSSDLYNLIYSSTQEIAGIQFNHNGCINNMSGGQAGNAGWILSFGPSAALGFSFSGSVLPIGTNLVLTQLSLEQNGENNIGDCIFVDDCLTNIDECAFSNPAGDNLTIIYSSNP